MSNKPKYSKNDAELYLNDFNRSEFQAKYPEFAAALFVKKDAPGHPIVQFGRRIRERHRAMFDAWFENSFKIYGC